MFGCCVIIFGFNYLAVVFGFSTVTDFMPEIGFLTFFSSSVIICNCVVGFNELEAVPGCLTVTYFMSLWLFYVFGCFVHFLPLFFKNNSVFFSFSRVRYLFIYISSKYY